MPIWPVLTKIMSITRTPSGMVCTEGGSLGKGFVLVQPLRQNLTVLPPYGLRLPASASCKVLHLRPAGRCPNNSSLFPPLAAVVVVA